MCNLVTTKLDIVLVIFIPWHQIHFTMQFTMICQVSSSTENIHMNEELKSAHVENTVFIRMQDESNQR